MFHIKTYLCIHTNTHNQINHLKHLCMRAKKKKLPPHHRSTVDWCESDFTCNTCNTANTSRNPGLPRKPSLPRKRIPLPNVPHTWYVRVRSGRECVCWCGSCVCVCVDGLCVCVHARVCERARTRCVHARTHAYKRVGMHELVSTQVRHQVLQVQVLQRLCPSPVKTISPGFLPQEHQHQSL